MKTLFPLALAALLLAVPACTEPQPERYPVSGEECAPGDPVQGMNAPADCLPAV